jgi:SAM-dependent methyltransferase
MDPDSGVHPIILNRTIAPINMTMDFSFPRYLLAKQTVDDRALNRYVYETLTTSLPQQVVRIIDVGAGVGTMLVRLMRWGLVGRADYTVVDSIQENIDYALGWIPQWAARNNFQVELIDQNKMRVNDETRDVLITFECADVFDFIKTNPPKADLLIAHAFLDLLPLPDSLPKLFSLIKPGGLAWLTLNFDGVTTFEPVIDPKLDTQIEQLYHQTMDDRPSGGDSRSGRHLFKSLQDAGADILAAGSSDWVVFAQNGKYPSDETYFLQFILHFFEQSLTGHPNLDADSFAAWLKKRLAQIDRGELVYIAHQIDFLVQPQPSKSV